MSDDLDKYPRPYAEREPGIQIPLAAWFFAVALIAASLTTFGTVPGSIIAGVVLFVWAIILLTQMTVVEKVVITVIMSVLVGLLLPAVESQPRPARRATCQNNLKQLGLALHTYHSIHGSFPPAYIAGPDGKPWHSWRVLILPFVEEGNRYERYRFDEPWNGPNNRLLADGMPSVLGCPAHDDAAANQTSYFAIVGPRTMWPGTKRVRIDDIRDGTPNTLALVEWSGRKVSWMEPVDVSQEEVVDLFSRSDPPDVAHGYLACTALADGSVESLEFGLVPEFVASHCEIDDGRRVERKHQAFAPAPESAATRWARWVRPFGWILVAVIALLPVPWAITRMLRRY